MGELPEPLNGIYRGKTQSQGFIQIAEPPAQNVDKCRAQGFNLASLTTDINALRQPFLNPALFPTGDYLHYCLILLRRPLRPVHLPMKALFLI